MLLDSSGAGVTFGIIGVGDPDAGTSRGVLFSRLVPTVGGRVSAFCDLSEANARRAAAAEHGARAFRDIDAFLDSGIDAAIICTPVDCHVEQAVQCLERGIHVLSEVPAASTLEGARRLVQVASRSPARYMLAENYRYYDEVELVKRMVDDGRFGHVYFAEGAYLLDWKRMWRGPDGELTWRGRGYPTVYCTHNLGPILYWLGDRIAGVSCLANPASLYDPEVDWQGNHVMLMRTVGGRNVLLRVDTISSRPLDTRLALQGTGGAYASDRLLLRFEHDSRVWLGGHERSRPWSPLWRYADEYIGDRADETERVSHRLPRGYRSVREWRLLREFVRSIAEGTPSPIDVHAAMDYTVPGIVAARSALQGGEMLPVPDSREWVG